VGGDLWLDPARSSYAEFLHFIDSMKVEGLLIVGVRGYQHEQSVDFTRGAPPTVGKPGSGEVTRTARVFNGNFTCDVFATNSLITPVWRAEIGEQGHPRSTKSGLTDKLVQQVVASLKNSPYIAR
jgi:hypothetical protein